MSDVEKMSLVGKMSALDNPLSFLTTDVFYGQPLISILTDIIEKWLTPNIVQLAVIISFWGRLANKTIYILRLTQLNLVICKKITVKSYIAY